MRHLLLGLSICLLSAQAQKAKPPLYFYFDGLGFSANGRWISADPKQKGAFPSEVQLECNRSTKLCTEATAEYFSGHPHVSIDYLNIERWDANGIVASGSGSICMIRMLTISFADKTIVQAISSKVLSEEKRTACKFLSASGTELEKFVIKNSDAWVSDPYGESLSKF